MLADGALMGHYQENYELLKHQRWNLEDLDNMYPFERAIYTSLLLRELQQKKEEAGKR